jgi:hypothetical protein
VRLSFRASRKGLRLTVEGSFERAEPHVNGVDCGRTFPQQL